MFFFQSSRDSQGDECPFNKGSQLYKLTNHSNNNNNHNNNNDQVSLLRRQASNLVLMLSTFYLEDGLRGVGAYFCFSNNFDVKSS